MVGYPNSSTPASMKIEENESKNMGRKGIRHIIVYSFSNQREQHITYMHATTVGLQLLLNTITKQTARSNTQSYGKLYYVLPELFNNIPRASVQLSENGNSLLTMLVINPKHTII